ncbi:T9SS type A sorting domain-containing protein [candidate division KSB1 bacterium]|nr:T9SS type A sorting domain-containing protein [candidate division KSB1 bacterium]
MSAKKKINIIIILVVILSYSRMAQSQSIYFPIEINNSWTYHEFGAEYLKHTIKIIDSTTIDGNLCYYYGESIGTSEIIFPDSLNRIWKYFDEKKQLWFDFSKTEADSYFYKDDDSGFNYTVKINRHPSLIVKPDFVSTDSCLLFIFDDPNVIDEELYYVFALSIGLIKKSRGIGITHLLESAVIGGKEVTKINRNKKNVPVKTVLKHNYPNPFNHETTIHYELVKHSHITIKVYNTAGLEIKILVDKVQNAGRYSVEWNGKNNWGQMVTSGVYLLEMRTEDSLQVRKMTMLR